MLKKIEALRKAPKEVRNRYAFWTAALFTSVIILFWLVSVPAKLAFFNTVATPEVELQGGVSRTFSDLRNLISTPEAEKETEVPEEIIVDGMDFNTFFVASTTSEAPEVEKPTVQKRTVLIGTTTKKTSTSTQ